MLNCHNILKIMKEEKKMQAQDFRPRNVIIITIIVVLSLIIGHAIYVDYIDVSSYVNEIVE